ncbi:DUF3769 domain-containing protein [Leptolyngbya sp. Cla-17]|uniref:DUF3769 domain-containing protein n=1 Tax=Leptolyngbya sp. Cla-17 TaxID=2803751 RepID=UPI0014930E72|nr:DUF3769 domain-containing protein [Leptolyngbya sp. Cla-17]
MPPELPPLHSSPALETILCPKLSLSGPSIAISEGLSPAIRKTIPTGIAPPEMERSLKTAAPQSGSLMGIASSTISPLQGKLSPQTPESCWSSSGDVLRPLPSSVSVKSVAKPENIPPELSLLPVVSSRGTVKLNKQTVMVQSESKWSQNKVVSPTRMVVQPRSLPSSKLIPPFKPVVVAQKPSTQKIPAATKKNAPSAFDGRSNTKKAITPTKPSVPVGIVSRNAPAKISPPQTPSLSYSISGVSGKLPQTAEAAVMKKLDQAFVFDQLVEVYDAIGSLTARDLRRLAKRSPRQIIPLITAQTPDAPTPLQLPTDILIPPSSSPSGTPDALSLPSENPESLNSVPLVDPLPTDQVPISILRQIVSESATSPTASPTASPTVNPTVDPTVDPVEVTADRLDYDERNQVFTAEGKVIMRFRNGLVDADRVQVNLTNRIAVAEGNVAFTRGQQVLRGQRAELNFIQGIGNIQQAQGDIYIPTAGTDISVPAATDGVAETVLGRPVSDRITSQQPLQNPAGAGGVSISAGAGRDVNRIPGGLPKGGQLKRLRFEAERIDFTPDGWVATNIQITNDPFSPPELVLRAEKATLTRLSPLQDEVRLTRPRLVFDQKFSLPFLFSRTVLDRRQRDAAPFRFAYDAQDRGGLYLEGVFNVLQSPKLSFTLYPQIFIQRMFDNRQGGIGVVDPSSYGLRTRLDAELSPSTFLRGSAALTSFDPAEFENSLRASVRVRQILATPIGPHTLALEYSYRDRLFNGSLGFQTVQSSIGLLLISPNILLGQSGVVLNYQIGYQSINSDTDRPELLSVTRTNNRVDLGRFQATFGVGKTFTLWQGKPLPSTRDLGLRYSANPIVPYLNFNTSLRGVYSNYTSGDVQQNVFAVAGLAGQFGHFSRNFLDYTAFSVSYSQAIGTGESPFLFDRVVDTRVVSLSFIQQIYGPFRAGFTTAISLDTTDPISTDYFLEYSRRTYGVILRYNPVLEIGSITLRISDFNWTGTADPFSGTGVTPVEGGVNRPSTF